mgnify:CR=1 FL=1|tara:strand:+ start:359 stop:1471 length:1113 start_codon:yes stop_codon:yes gene_type:complete
MTGFSFEHVLIFAILGFLLYFTLGKCNCNGFRVGVQPINSACDEGNKNTCISTKKCNNFDLSYCNLSNADLSGANCSGINFSSANLSGANLTGVDLSNANCSGTNFSNANLTSASLDSANLTNANCSGTNFSNANGSDTNFSNANFTNADFTNAWFMHAECIYGKPIIGIETARIDPMPDGSPAIYRCLMSSFESGPTWQKVKATYFICDGNTGNCEKSFNGSFTTKESCEKEGCLTKTQFQNKYCNNDTAPGACEKLTEGKKCRIDTLKDRNNKPIPDYTSNNYCVIVSKGIDPNNRVYNCVPKCNPDINNCKRQGHHDFIDSGCTNSDVINDKGLCNTGYDERYTGDPNTLCKWDGFAECQSTNNYCG